MIIDKFNMRIKQLVALLLIIGSFAGCRTVQPVPRETKPITLDAIYQRRGTGVTADLPAGEYKPAFQDSRGTYYTAPGGVIIVHYLLNNQPNFGGLFIPHPHIQDQRQGFWIKELNRVVKFKDPISLDESNTTRTAPKQ
jgi:hypothetical protein